MLWRIDDASDTPKAGDTVYEAIKPGETVSPQILADRLGLPGDTVGKRLERLAAEGRLVRVKRGHYCLPEGGLDNF